LGDYYDQAETMTAAARAEYFNTKIAATMADAYALAPAVRAIFDAAGLNPEAIRTVADLARVPVTRKEDLMTRQREDPPYGGFETIPHPDIARVFISPGPLYEPNFALDVAFFARAFHAAGFGRGDVALNSFTYHMSPAGHVMEEGARACGASVIPAGTGSTESQLQTMRDLGVTAYIGTPSYLMAMIKKAEEDGADFRRDYGLKRAWFTGEPLAPSTRRTLNENYGILTFQAYAVTELGGAISYECGAAPGMHLSDEYVTEIIDPVTGAQLPVGEVGEITVTPINNPTWALVRYGTGDLAYLTDEPCPCGRTSARIVAIVGRAGDAVKVRGMFVVARQAEGVFAGIPEVARCQMVVERADERDCLTLNLEMVAEGTDADAVKTLLAQKFQETCRVRADAIVVLAPGTLAADAATIDDRRKWE
jgi:phenylacetate-CoA ligase